ncbi:MAG: HAD-IB family phosphatase [Xanthomonadaceae bacterium]|nr:HAD-IB family phosphatase [Xanthomonadaceae bacterium]MDP2184816.1 HAD-IB family phosphatase [Xanthomonadales bacterium]MDZ4116040.1 HAD-IB family phosphatase [Xanthomonadaceae bacterium]MDZ4376750.1 HAD-IB family phosphatase [Xanthomonadaceae bacterium]
MSRVVLFDFDGTLIRGDCVSGLLRRLLSTSRWRRALALLAMPLLLGFMWWRTARLPAMFFLWLAMVGRSEAEYQQACAAFVADFTRDPQRRVIQVAMQRLRAHLAAGDRVYIVTAANESLATAIWAAIDGPPVSAIIGSQIRRGFAGWLWVFHCFGPRKLWALAQVGVLPPFAVAYSDSSKDLPMLLAAHQRVLVEPSARSLRRFRRALPEFELIRD